MRIAVIDAEGPLGAPAVAALSAAGAAVAPVTLDGDGDVTASVERAIDELGGLDVLANLTKPTEGAMPAVDVSHAAFDRVFKTCLRATRTSNQAAFRHMSEAGGGHVVNHAEMAGELGEAGRALPATVAQAVVAWSRAAAGAWFFQGVRVNVFQPSLGADLDRTVLPMLLFLIGGNATVHGLTVSC